MALAGAAAKGLAVEGAWNKCCRALGRGAPGTVWEAQPLNQLHRKEREEHGEAPASVQCPVLAPIASPDLGRRARAASPTSSCTLNPPPCSAVEFHFLRSAGQPPSHSRCHFTSVGSSLVLPWSSLPHLGWDRWFPFGAVLQPQYSSPERIICFLLLCLSLPGHELCIHKSVPGSELCAWIEWGASHLCQQGARPRRRALVCRMTSAAWGGPVACCFSANRPEAQHLRTLRETARAEGSWSPTAERPAGLTFTSEPTEALLQPCPLKAPSPACRWPARPPAHPGSGRPRACPL